MTHLKGRREIHRLDLLLHGLTLPWSFPERMWVIEGTRL